MKTTRPRLAIAGALLSLGGCVTFPNGPSVMALPGSQMSFDQFRADDYACRSYASQSIGGQDAQQAAVHSGVTSAVVGSAVGAVAGAAGGFGRGGVATPITPSSSRTTARVPISLA